MGRNKQSIALAGTASAGEVIPARGNGPLYANLKQAVALPGRPAYRRGSPSRLVLPYGNASVRIVVMGFSRSLKRCRVGQRSGLADCRVGQVNGRRDKGNAPEH